MAKKVTRFEQRHARVTRQKRKAKLTKRRMSHAAEEHVKKMEVLGAYIREVSRRAQPAKCPWCRAPIFVVTRPDGDFGET